MVVMAVGPDLRACPGHPYKTLTGRCTPSSKGFDVGEVDAGEGNAGSDADQWRRRGHR
jgi:hypothetical protein